MASTDVIHAQKFGGSTTSTDSKDSSGSDYPYVCFESVEVKDQLSSSNDSSDKSTDSQFRSHGHAKGEYEASNRTNVHTNNQNEGKGHINQGFADSGPFETIPRDSLNLICRKVCCLYVASSDMVAFFHDVTIYTTTDITSNAFMMRPDIHVLKDKNNLPKFTTPMGKQQYKPHKTECKIPWRDSNNSWPQIPCSLIVDETENVIETTNGINMIDDEDLSSNADSELFENSRRNSLYPTENVTQVTNGINMLTNNDNRFQDIDYSRRDSLFADLENQRKRNKNCLLRILILMLIVGCISGTVAWIIHNKYFLGSKDPPNIIVDTPIFPDKCENDISTATVGEQMCIPLTQEFTSSPSGFHVRQVSSKYLSVPHGFSVNVSSDAFEQQNGGWIINFNSSRTDQQIRFMKGKATCDSIGIYEIKIEYEDGSLTSSEFEIKLKDPQLQHSVTRIDDSIHVHCEMIKTCIASSLALFVNDGGSSRMIPNINVCSYNDKESGTTVSADAIIPASWFSENTTIACVPLMTDPELAANLTSTTGIPVCVGDCVPDCKDDPQGEAYFPDKDDCTHFYQCSNGKLVSQTCSLSTYWSPTECTCVHFDDEICNRDTNRFFKPLLSIEKCTNASLV